MAILDTVLHGILLGQPGWFWLIFGVSVVVLLALDLGVLHRRQRAIGVAESFWLAGFYAVIGLLFGLFVWSQMGLAAAENYLTGYLVELSLSMDNIFVISLVFTYFAVPREYQHRVLFWGIVGAIVMRGAMIVLGAALVKEFHWVQYLFGGFLLLTGLKMLFGAGKEMDIGNNPVLRIVRRRLRVADTLHGENFWIKLPDPKNPQRFVRYATPLFLALLVIELVDVVFAVDSVPAIFAITQDPFIVYTSNIFAILGLRALYFALAAMIHRFKYLKYALALVLVFIGAKIFVAEFIAPVPSFVSLALTVGVLAAGVVVSLFKTRSPSPIAPARAVADSNART